jgi:hypothetical protein
MGPPPKRLLPLPARERIEDSELPAYDGVIERQAKLWAGAPTDSNAYFGALLNSPPLAAAVVQLGAVFRTGSLRGTYSDAERELVDVVLGVDLGYNTILKLHLPDMVAVGVRLEAIKAIRSGDLDLLTPEERQIVDYVREALNGEVTDASHAEMVERFGERGALEFTVFVPFLQMTFRAWQAIGVPDVSDREIDEMLAAYGRGEGATVAADARLG